MGLEKKPSLGAEARESIQCVANEVNCCNGSHNAVAAITHKLLKGRYVCALPNGKLWYSFNGLLWEEDKDAVRMRHELSTTVRDQFMIAMNKDMQSMQNLREMCSARDHLMRVASSLQDAGFKGAVIRELREYMYDETFLSGLDADPNLLAFTNGV